MTKDQILKQIDVHIDLWRSSHAKSEYDDLSDLPESETTLVLTRLTSAIERLAPEGSRYRKNAHAALSQYGETNSFNIQLLAGILQALRADYEAGYLESIEALIHADVFSDFLDMARYLLTEGYKDPAAVLVGGVIEEQLRKLSLRNGVSIESAGKPRKASALTSDLASAGVISKLDLKNVTAWLDLRNKAAHGKYEEYTQPQVELLLQSVQDFLTRVPA